MGMINFKCPVCGKDIHFKDANNVFPVNYKLKCKHCTSIFGFVPKVFVRADFTLHGSTIEPGEIEDILDFDEDKGEPVDLSSMVDEFEGDV
jgi:hypothetical protein